MDVVATIRATLSYARKFTGSTVLIKLGGAALEDKELATAICEDLSLIRSMGLNVILVHGGGPSINKELTSKGIQWSFLDGQRITTPEMMDTIEMVLCGFVNRRIVRSLNRFGIPAVGFSGADAKTLFCKQSSPDLGQVGEILSVNAEFIRSVLNAKAEPGAGTIPVIAPIGIGVNGESYNINADWAAVRIAQALEAPKVIFLTDQSGILDTEGKLIQRLSPSYLEDLIGSGVVKGGMLAKVRTILYALNNGIRDVHVLNARRPHVLIEELFTDEGVGTVCRREGL